MDMAKLITADASGALRQREAQPAATPPRGSERSGGATPAKAGSTMNAEPRRDPGQEVEVIERLRKAAEGAQSRLLIDRDEEAGQFIYKFMDPETGETVRQWPPERYLDLITYLREKQGGLLDRKV